MTRSNLPADNMIKTPSSAARRTASIRELPREVPCERMGLCDRQHPGSRMRMEPSGGGILREEEVHVPAESVADVAPFEQMQREDRARGLQLVDPFRADEKAHRRARGSARRRPARRSAEHRWDAQRIAGAPGIEPPSADLEEVHGGPQRQAGANDVSGVVEFQGRDLSQEI